MSPVRPPPQTPARLPSHSPLVLPRHVFVALQSHARHAWRRSSTGRSRASDFGALRSRWRCSLYKRSLAPPRCRGTGSARALSSCGWPATESSPGSYRMSSGALLRVGAKGLVDRRCESNSRRVCSADGGDSAHAPKRPACRCVPLVLTGAEPRAGRDPSRSSSTPACSVIATRAARPPTLVAEAGASSAEAVTATRRLRHRLRLRAGYIEVEIEHVGSGRTIADSVVLFRELRGRRGRRPLHGRHAAARLRQRRQLRRWAAAIAHLTSLLFDVIVPSQGAPVGRGELAAFKEKLSSPGAASPRPTTAAAK